MSQTSLHSLESFQENLVAHPRVLLFKHSPVCPVSDEAHSHWQTFLGDHPEVPTLFVDVIADRPVARGLAQECGVTHASPQAILFAHGVAVWDASHGGITAETLRSAWVAD